MTGLTANSRGHKDKLQLPIDAHHNHILYLLEKHRVLIVVGETGSGKSTRIPQILLSAGVYNEKSQNDDRHKIIGITQPRRVAAIQLAQRVSQCIDCDLGSIVGYAVRFQDVIDEQETMVKFMTEGLLIREMMYDPLLAKYSVIIVDEVHERNINTDILLGLLKCILLKRNDLKLIVCSATMNTENVQDFFTYETSDLHQDKKLDKPALLKVHGRTFTFDIYYLQQPSHDYVTSTVDTVIKLHESNRLKTGKILSFLPGLEEIDIACEKLDEYSRISSTRLDIRKLLVLPLHSHLKADEVSKVFETYPKDTRLCILATNIAETSLTIEDVAFVIDSGYTKIKIYDHKTGVDALVRVPISKRSAVQRAGRAGRTRAGSVYRLYPEQEYEQLAEDTVPEIQRTTLAETVMLLKSLGVDDLLAFPLISSMPKQNLIPALELLHALQAVDSTGKLTSCGLKMAYFNLDPKISRFLINSQSFQASREACRIASMLEVKEIYFKTRKYASEIWENASLAKLSAPEGDLLTYLNIFNGFINNDKSRKWAERRNLNYQALMNALEISKRLENQLVRCGIKMVSCNGRNLPIQKSLVSGLFPNAAYLHPSGEYRTIRGDQIVHLHPMSVFSNDEVDSRPKHVVFGNILSTTKTFIRHVMSVEPAWLTDAAPHYYTFGTSLQVSRFN